MQPARGCFPLRFRRGGRVVPAILEKRPILRQEKKKRQTFFHLRSSCRARAGERKLVRAGQAKNGEAEWRDKEGVHVRGKEGATHSERRENTEGFDSLTGVPVQGFFNLMRALGEKGRGLTTVSNYLRGGKKKTWGDSPFKSHRR